MNDPLPPATRPDAHLVRAAFDAAAARYDDCAVLQREVGTRLLERLDLVKLVPARVLDLGCGTGLHTRALLDRYPQALVCGADLAPAMCARTRARSGWFRRLRAVCADAARLPFADDSLDLVWSNFTLQWCGAPDAVFAEVRRVLRPGGLFLFTTLGPDTLRELRAAWATVDDRPHVNDFTDMHDVGDALVRARLADPVLDVERFTLTYPDVLALMRELKAIGAHNVLDTRARGLTGRGRLAAMSAAYERERRDGVLPASYEVVYGHAWAPAQKLSVDGPGGVATFPLSGLRRRPPAGPAA